MAKDSVTMILHDSSQERYTGYKSGSTDIHTARVVCIIKPQISRASSGICAAISQENITFNTDHRTIDAILMKMTQKTVDVLNLNNS